MSYDGFDAGEESSPEEWEESKESRRERRKYADEKTRKKRKYDDLDEGFRRRRIKDDFYEPDEDYRDYEY